MHFHAWKRGLKTGMYYLRTQAASRAVQFTVEKQAGATLEPVSPGMTVTETSMVATDAVVAASGEAGIAEGAVCRMEEGCVVCGS